MNLNHLEYLITVAENGSINRAAQALYVSQPYLSGVIKSVEEELGFPVFRRSSTGVEPTELGGAGVGGSKAHPAGAGADACTQGSAAAEPAHRFVLFPIFHEVLSGDAGQAGRSATGQLSRDAAY